MKLNRYEFSNGSALLITLFSRTRSPQAQGSFWAQTVQTLTHVYNQKGPCTKSIDNGRIHTPPTLLVLVRCSRNQVRTQRAVVTVSARSFSTFDFVRQSPTIVYSLLNGLCHPYRDPTFFDLLRIRLMHDWELNSQPLVLNSIWTAIPKCSVRDWQSGPPSANHPTNCWSDCWSGHAFRQSMLESITGFHSRL